MLVVLVEVIMLPSCCSFVPLLIKKKNLCAFCSPCVPIILHMALSVVTVY